VNNDNYQNTPPEGYGYENTPYTYPSFSDIFKHAWPVLWEKPRVIICLVLFITAFQTCFDQVSNVLFEPYTKDFSALAASGEANTEKAQEAFINAVKEKGSLQLILAILIPFLATPFLSFCLSKGALSIWDGFMPSLRDIGQALASYPKCLLFLLGLCFYGFVLSFLTLAMCTPSLLIFRLTGKAGVLLGGFAFIITVYLWIKFLWPIVRRFLFLQFFVFFHISDHPGGTDLFKKILEMDRQLKYWPSHLNYMALNTFLTILVLFIAVTMIELALLAFCPNLVARFVGQFMIILGMCWPIIAIAGFYRICLCPPEDQPPTPQYQPEYPG
jgi:hypothetical protein